MKHKLSILFLELVRGRIVHISFAIFFTQVDTLLSLVLLLFPNPFPRGVSFLYIVSPNASDPSTYTSQGCNWDACPIKTLLEVVESVVCCGTTVQVSFPYKCSQLSRCSALSAEVMTTFPKYLISSSPTRLWCLLQCPTFWHRWPIEAFPRCICSLDSSDSGSVRFSSLDFCSHVKSESVWYSCLPSSSLVHVSGLDWCMDRPFPVLGLGLWDLRCVWILPSLINI